MPALLDGRDHPADSFIPAPIKVVAEQIASRAEDLTANDSLEAVPMRPWNR